VFSQDGEDGIILEILRRVGVKSRRFLEIGVGNGLENNTAFLLYQGWSGMWIEASERNIEQIARTSARHRGGDELKAAHATANIGTCRDLSDDVDLFSIDIDRNVSRVGA
jgi:hypothetical protein